MVAAPRLQMTEAEYLRFEREADTRHEFVDGELVAMSGGTPLHALVATNILGELHHRLRGGPCRAYNSDLRVHLAATGMYCYPDATVVCGPLERHPADAHVVTNPSLVVEVYSPSTRAYDQGPKAAHYRLSPGIQTILLVDPLEQTVEQYTRLDGERWEVRLHPATAELHLAHLDLRLPVADLFAGTEAERAAERDARGDTRRGPV